MNVSASFDVDDYFVCTRVDQLSNVFVWLKNHQVDFQRDGNTISDCVDDYRTEGDGRDELSVHDVDVDAIGSGLFSFGYLVSETRKVCREY